MDEQQQVVTVRRRRSRAEAEELAAEYKASGLSRVDFCRKHGLALATLTRYLKLRRQLQAERSGDPCWLAVELSGGSPAPGSGSGLAVALARGRRIEVCRGFDGQTLVQLVGLLERL